jgi:hypothetical protein
MEMVLVDRHAKRNDGADDEPKPASKFKAGDYEVIDLTLEHDGKRYARGQKVHLSADEAERLAAVGAIKA